MLNTSAWAHSESARGERHDLVAHLESTAALAETFAQPFGGGAAARRAGLWHDLGKFSCSWQEYLAAREAGRSAQGVDHKQAGARIAERQGMRAVACAIAGHHGGLQSPAELRLFLGDANLTSVAEVALARATLAGVDLFGDRDECLPEHARDPLGLETFTRFLLSVLADADYLDTAAHFQGLAAPTPSPEVDWEHHASGFERSVDHMLAGRPSSPIDHVRSEIRVSCSERAALPPGIFRLAVPTGGGKTIAGMQFAVRHAAHHQLRRVIVAVPYTSITEQNADVYRNLFMGDGSDERASRFVLEHHSMGEYRGDIWWARLAAENWDAPVVVTTTVQLFQSLFARNPAAVRKLHRLSRSVIVLDEVQALPHRLLMPILGMLRRLVDSYGATVVLSSATQPELWELSPFKDVPVTDLAPSAGALHLALRRAQFVWLEGRHEWSDVADRLADEDQVLAIVNTTADAASLAGLVQNRDSDAVHLSTRMCPAHRRHELRRVRELLAVGAPCRVVSTQLVEAGVDLDFPTVWRAMGPADSLLQAAGRCNREGRLPEVGRVVIFNPLDGHLPPGPYKTATQRAGLYFGPPHAGLADPDDLDALARYYIDLFDLTKVASDPSGVLAAQAALDYPTVAERFRMIDNDTVDVVVARSITGTGHTWFERPALERALHSLELIESGQPLASPGVYRSLRPFTVSLLPGVLRRMPGLVSELADGLLCWNGRYDPFLGLVVTLAPEDFIL